MVYMFGSFFKKKKLFKRCATGNNVSVHFEKRTLLHI